MIKKLLVSLLAVIAITVAAQAEHKMQASDKEDITELYADMYRVMIAKDTIALGRMLDDSFVLIHMTGMRQPKREYLKYIANGTLNYYSCEDTNLDITVNGDNAHMIGKSQVLAAVFGGGRHRWPLQLDMTLKKENGKWLITQAVASTY